MHVVQAIALSLALLASGISDAHATLRVSPLYLDLDTAGAGAQGEFKIGNDRDTAIAIEVQVFRSATLSGNAAGEVPAADDFAVFPAQALIEPAKSQIFRIRYTGKADPGETVRYALSFHELPIRFSEDRPDATISLLLDFRVGVFVSPPEAVAKLEIGGARRDGQAMRFTVTNSGTRYAALADRWLALIGPDGEIGRLAGERLLDENVSTVVPPLGSQEFLLTLPPAFGEAQSIDLRNARSE